MSRMPWPAAVGGALIAALGIVGVVLAWRPSGSAPASAGGASGSGGAITVTGAWVRQPVPPVRLAAAYFTVHNDSSSPDKLVAVATDAGSGAVLHTAGMTRAGAVGVAAHGTLTLSTGHGHVMIEGVKRDVKPGHSIELDLTFAHAGLVTVDAPVISYNAQPPAGSA